MMKNRVAVFAVVIIAFATTFGEAGFALNREDERDLLGCFRRSQNSEICFGKIRRMKRSTVESQRDLQPAYEYLCAMNDYLNTRETNDDVFRAVLDAGSCSRAYPSVAKTWRDFLSRRKHHEMRMHVPTWQNRTGSTISVGFTSDNTTSSHALGSLMAVDLVISRSRDDEIYGRYILRASIQGPVDDELVVHDTMQATCPSNRRRFFVAGLNDYGLHAADEWRAEVGSVMEFSIDIAARRRIIKGSPSRYGRRDTLVDIEPKVSAIVLHFSKTSFAGVPMPDGMLFPPQARRHRRNAVARQGDDTPCHRESYLENYRYNVGVVRPAAMDIGECVGNCDRVRTSSADLHLNATNHALVMVQAGQMVPTPGNPEPTVCCIPIAYKRFWFITMDARGVLMSTSSGEMVADYCGCR